jgi:colanic acid biosynthesis glycosyl transferase WcaI
VAKIIFVNRYFCPDESATSQMTSSLAFGLADLGWQIHVITSRQLYHDAGAKLAKRDSVRNVSVHRLWTTCFGRGRLIGRAVDYFSFYLSIFGTLLRIARRGDVIVATTDPPLVSVLVWFVTAITGATQVNWMHDVFPEVARVLGVVPTGFGYRLLVRLRNASLRNAVINVTVGDRMAAYLQQQGVPSERLMAIHNWADGAAILPLAPLFNPLREEWGLKDKFVVGYSGNLGRAHEFATILRAAEALRNEPQIRFLFIGTGHQLASIEAEAQRRALTNVVIRPFQPSWRLKLSLAVPDVHLVSLQAALEGLVLPSKFYGIAAAGRPTIFVGDPAGEIPQVLAEASCGSTVAVADADALVHHITRLHHSPAQRELWGSNARALFTQRFDRPVAIARWSKVIADATAAAIAAAPLRAGDAMASGPAVTIEAVRKTPDQ